MAPRTAAVIGGGIGGLAAAIALRDVGIEATVYERAEAFTEVGAGISLWPNATRALRQLGALDPLVASAGGIAALNVRDARGRRLLRAPVESRDAPALCVYRPELIDALRTRLPEEACRTGKALAELDARGGRARLRFADETVAEADIVVGADGLRSTVRTSVFPEEGPPVHRGYVVWRGVGPLPRSFEPGEISESWGDRLRFGLLDMGGARAYWYATAPRREGKTEADPAVRKAEVLQLFAEWHPPVLEAVDSTPAANVLCGDVYDRAPRRGWHRNQAILIGDAAHPSTPNLGQGGAMAIEDALVLAQCLAKSPPSEAFSVFEQARFRRTSRVTTESRWTGWLGLVGGTLGKVRDTITRATPDGMYAKRMRWLFEYRT